jgi:mono/diheme cytochrome c family protein
MIRYLLLGSLLCTSPALAQERVPLKPGPGLDAVTSTCSTCHTLNYIRMNSVFLTPDAWKAEVAKMRAAYGAPIEDDTEATIDKYLAATYAAAPKS